MEARVKSNKFEKMLDKFLKTSKDKIRESERSHTKREGKISKKENAKRRKIALAKKNRGM